MTRTFTRLAALALSLAVPTMASAADITGLWRIDIVNPGGTTLGAMTVQTRDTVQRQADAQHDWALAKGHGGDGSRSAPRPNDTNRPGSSGYAGYVVTDQGGHALPIESIEIADGRMVMVVGSPRGLVIFRGTVNADETRFDGKLTYHNGSVFDMHGVKQVRPL